MLHKYKNSLILFPLTIILAIVTSFVVEGTSFLIRFINGAFYLSLLYMMIGGFLYLTENGFFNITKYGFKKTFGKKQSELTDEKVSKEMIYERKTFFLTTPLLLNGIVFAVLTLLFSLLL